MNVWIAYIAGVLTPVALFIAIDVAVSLGDLREDRRYQRAYKKFNAEYDALTDQEFQECQLVWNSEPHRYRHYYDNRARYFNMRWNYGNTTEV